MMLWWAAKGVFFCLFFITKYKFKLKQYTPTPSPARLYKILNVKKVKQKQIVTLDIIEVSELNRITWVESWTWLFDLCVRNN